MQIGDWGERLDARTQHSGIPSVGPSLCQDAKAGKFENLPFLLIHFCYQYSNTRKEWEIEITPKSDYYPSKEAIYKKIKLWVLFHFFEGAREDERHSAKISKRLIHCQF